MRKILIIVLILLLNLSIVEAVSVGFVPPIISLSLEVGKTANLVVLVRNDDVTQKDIVQLHIATNSDKLKNWVWFDRHKSDQYRRDLNVSLDPGEQTGVSILLLGGQQGENYDLWVEATSLLIGETDCTNENECNPENPSFDPLMINIVYNPTGTFGSAPGLSWMSFILIISFAAFVLYEKKII